jgi:poly(A) polymerase
MRFRYSAGKDGKLVKKAAIYTRDEHGINYADVDSEAVSIVRKLKAAGFDTYIVGGAVRDLILGKKPKDFDIVSVASPTRIKKIFRNSRIIGRRFRLVHVYFGQRIFEVSTFRSLKDGRTSNTFGTIDEDVFRRDFTMNALFYDPEQQIVVDYVGGLKDIKKRQVKPVIPLSEIFTDDPVRMIRAVKYAAAVDFSLPLNLKMKIKKQSALLSSISSSRLTEEIFKIIHSNRAEAIVDMLDKLGLYCYLQPQAAKLMRTDSRFRQRYLQSMAAFNGSSDFHDYALRALFNDYLESVRDWEPGVIENFTEIFKIARSFVLPMNPPRFEMEHAVRKFLSAHGITIKRPQPKPPHETGAPEHAGTKRKRRRRRKPKITGSPS